MPATFVDPPRADAGRYSPRSSDRRARRASRPAGRRPAGAPPRRARASKRIDSLAIAPTSPPIRTPPSLDDGRRRSGSTWRSHRTAWRRYARVESSARPSNSASSSSSRSASPVRPRRRGRRAARRSWRSAVGRARRHDDRAAAELAQRDRRVDAPPRARTPCAISARPSSCHGESAAGSASMRRDTTAGNSASACSRTWLEPWRRRGLEREVGRAVGGVLVAGAPLGLGEVDGGGRAARACRSPAIMRSTARRSRSSAASSSDSQQQRTVRTRRRSNSSSVAERAGRPARARAGRAPRAPPPGRGRAAARASPPRGRRSPRRARESARARGPLPACDRGERLVAAAGVDQELGTDEARRATVLVDAAARTASYSSSALLRCARWRRARRSATAAPRRRPSRTAAREQLGEAPVARSRCREHDARRAVRRSASAAAAAAPARVVRSVAQ